MLFLIAITFLAYANFAFAWPMLTNPIRAKSSPFLMLAHMMTLSCFATGFLLSLMPESRVVQGDLIVPAFMGFGVGSACLFGWRIVSVFREKTDKSLLSWKTGMSVWAFLAGVFVMFTVVDHWMFFWAPGETGVADLRFMDIKDMECKGKVLVRLEKSDVAYRCPTEVVFGSELSSQPFAPWPGYQEGHSIDVKNALDKLVADAKLIGS